jgi:hypothetical protein
MSTHEKVWLRSHVERCLQDVWDEPDVVVDDDGDYPFRGETAAAWVRLETALDLWLVAVFAHAAFGVTPTVKLLKELDEIAASARAVSVFQTGGLVVVRQAVLAESVDVPSLRFAIDGVRTVADQVGQLVTTVYGGHTPLVPAGADRA